MFDFASRLARLQKRLEKAEAFWTTKREEVFYLTGFMGDDTAIVVTSEALFVITDQRYTEQLRYEAKVPYTLLLVESGRGRKERLLQVVKEQGIARLLLDKATFPLALYEYLSSNARVTFEESRLLREQRMVKDELEIEVMRQNLLITEWGFYFITRKTKPGRREEEIAAELEYFLKKKRGGEGVFL